MSKLLLKIVTPEKEVLNEEISGLNIQTVDGEIGIYPDHINLVAKIIPGEMKIKKSGKEIYFATGEGFIEIKNNVVTLLTDLAIDEKEINEKAAEDARKRAKDALNNILSDEEYAETFAALEKSIAQLNLKRKHKNF